MIDYNMNVINEWVEFGGVLGYETNRNGDVKLYIMDDGEFADRCMEANACGEEDEYARVLCEAALRNARICEEEIGLLMDWDASEIEESMEG